MSSTFTTTRLVQFSETDMAGIVHFSCFYKYMEEAEHEFFRSLGLSIMLKQNDGSIIGWPRVSAKCSFKAPARYEDLLEIRLNIERIGVKSLTLQYDFWRDDTLIAQGTMKTVCCLFQHDKEMQSIEIPATYQKKFEQ
ncbi:4-hydroxybenzoyl-CoA thioesterase family active site [hydrothermal vent metagenome]|uniref:4-hydroxybenzoyl-CoA thioesterase family active site n=2 Tax=hydrothermal vent metagenome TaxID=652676 RepID=A0A3B1DH83_9ZZZZ